MSNNPKMSVIIPVYNALGDVKLCLDSILKNFNFDLGNVCVINDCSNSETTTFLDNFAQKHLNIKVLKNEENLGFVKTCNRGMKLAQGDIVVLLNSDTKIPSQFCERIIKCFDSSDEIGIASPISSCSCTFYIEMPKNYTLEKMNKLLRENHKCKYPLIHAAEGFCYCIRKDVIKQQGYLDEAFGKGYHEEVDYAYRAITNGWKNVLIDDLYVYHKRQASFGAETREILIKQNNPVFKVRWAGFRENYVKENKLKNPVIKIEQEMFPERKPNSCKRTPLEFLFSIKNSNNKKQKIITFAGLQLKIKQKSLKNSKKKKTAKLKYKQITQKLPNVIVDKNKIPAINIFIPAINETALTAGPIGILYFAKWLVENNYNVAIYALSPNFNTAILKETNSLEILLEKAKITEWSNISEIVVSPDDICVATLWNTAYIAKHVQSFCNSSEFIYIIQDYESIFYANSSISALIENTYSFNYFPLFSTQALKDFFYKNNIGNISDRIQSYEIFNTAASAYLPNYNEFSNRSGKKKFVFYGRPHRKRNCFELGIEVIAQAVEKGILSTDEWDFYSVGASEGKIKINNDLSIYALPFMSVSEYKKIIYQYDLALSLMMSPHPSMVPIDLALSGVPVVTNTYKNKDEKYLKSISENIYSSNLNIDSLLYTLEKACEKVNDYKTRYENAKKSDYPQNWDYVFTNMDNLDKFLKNNIPDNNKQNILMRI